MDAVYFLCQCPSLHSGFTTSLLTDAAQIVGCHHLRYTDVVTPDALIYNLLLRTHPAFY